MPTPRSDLSRRETTVVRRSWFGAGYVRPFVEGAAERLAFPSVVPGEHVNGFDDLWRGTRTLSRSLVPDTDWQPL